MVVVHVRAGGEVGLGYTHADLSTANFIEIKLVPVVQGSAAMRTGQAWLGTNAAIRNAGRAGLGMMAISAVNIALWNLKARLLGVPVVDLLGTAHDGVPVYGSGGFTSYSLEPLQEQLAGWAEQGIPRVKMKTSREPDRDPERLDAARKAIGDQTELYVDANGALSRTSPGAPGSPGCSRWPGWPRCTRSTSPRTARRRCRRTRSRRWCGSGTWSTSTTTSGSRACCSTGRSSPRRGCSAPTARGPASGTS
jgi:hypothetical protein